VQAQAQAQAVEQQKLESTKRARQAEDARRLEAQREDNLKRIQGLANGSGAPDSRGTAARASGPSASYGGRVAARIKPNIVFTEDIAGNPRAEIEVRTSPDGTIIGQRVLKSSGVRGWDEAVLKAVIKTEVLPRDVDGRVPASLIIDFRPKD
ncbi:MAG: cell envelope integrity protein TolA, partial [Ramlibacter sp.]|nr:cell envelope integrity protein TolA [Ramlibacter sp.]